MFTMSSSTRPHQIPSSTSSTTTLLASPSSSVSETWRLRSCRRGWYWGLLPRRGICGFPANTVFLPVFHLCEISVLPCFHTLRNVLHLVKTQISKHCCILIQVWYMFTLTILRGRFLCDCYPFTHLRKKV